MHIHAATAVIDNQLQEKVCVQSEHGLITAISLNCSSVADLDVSGTLIPGFVDIHSHGGGGFYFSNTDVSSVKKARATHLEHGTTTMLASLVTEPIGILEEQIRRLAPLVDEGIFAGIHLEGPYLSHARCGAHQPSLLRSPDLDEIGALLDTAGDTITMITLAPELEGGISAVEYLHSRGVTVALGHSQADSATTVAALSAGAALITHFSNGMPKPSNGSGTIAETALSSKDLPLELILDGVHVTDEVLSTIKASGKNRFILVTDAMSAAGQPDGKYSIGALDVEVKDGVARLTSNGSLAGSTLTMDQAFKNYLSSGASLVECVHATSVLPAQTVGLHDVGSITIGKKADFLEFTEAGEIKLLLTSSQVRA